MSSRPILCGKDFLIAEKTALGRFRGKGGDEQTLLRSMLDTLKTGTFCWTTLTTLPISCCASCNEEVSMACSNNMALSRM
jgi:hypothetical protein